MDQRMIVPILRRILSGLAVVLLLVMAWRMILGAFAQLPRVQTLGQAIETFMQLACALLSLLSAVSGFRAHRGRRPIRIAWAVSLILVAGASSLVWGPPMLLTAVAFAGAALLVASATVWVLSVFDHEPKRVVHVEESA